MKDGIYAVTVKVGDRTILAKAEVRNGVFRGLGEISHLTGYFTTPPIDDAAPVRPIDDAAALRALRESNEPALCAPVGEARGSVDDLGQERESEGEVDRES